MRGFRSVFAVVIAILLLGAGALFSRSYFVGRDEEIRVRARYGQMRAALSAGETNVAISLIAPEFRAGAHRSLELLDGFARPLNDQSAIRVSQARAIVCPRRSFHFGIIPGGHTIERVKVEGQWFFTGGVSID